MYPLYCDEVRLKVVSIDEDFVRAEVSAAVGGFCTGDLVKITRFEAGHTFVLFQMTSEVRLAKALARLDALQIELDVVKRQDNLRMAMRSKREPESQKDWNREPRSYPSCSEPVVLVGTGVEEALREPA